MRRTVLFILVSILFCTATAAQNRDFKVYDALLGYRHKPDVRKDGILPVKLIYENRLFTDGKMDEAKVKAVAKETKTQGLKFVSTDIESWYWTKNFYNDADLSATLQRVYDIFRAEIPDVILGNYGLPVNNYNVYRVMRKQAGDSEDAIVEKWTKSNENHVTASKISDVLLPSFYIANPDFEQWKKDVELSLKVIHEQYPGKPVIAYIWPQYYNLKGSDCFMEYIDAETWTGMLEYMYQNVDGVILWSCGRDTDNKTYLDWEDERVQNIYNATLKFMKKYKVNKPAKK